MTYISGLNLNKVDIVSINSQSNIPTDLSSINMNLSNLNNASSNYVTLTGIQTVRDKNFDFYENNFTNFPTGGGGTGSGNVSTGSSNIINNIPYWNANSNLASGIARPSGDLVGTTDSQTLTGKTIDANDNFLLNLPTFDSSTLQSNITINSNNITLINNRVNSNVLELISLDTRLDTAEINIADNETDIATLFYLTTSLSNISSNNTFEINDLNYRLDLAEDDITNTNNAVISNITNINSLSNALAINIGNLSILSGTVSTHTGQISTNSTNLTTLSNALAIDISNLSTLSTTVSTQTGQISNRVIAPTTNTASYIPQWAGANSKILVDGIDLATLTTLTGTQSLTNKTLTDITNNVNAKGLHSASTIVTINNNTPTSNQVLTAVSASNAVWKTPTSTGSSGYTVMPTQTLSGASTSYIFTGIPSTANQIIISLYAVFASNAGTIYFRIGTGSVLTSTNYSGLYTTFGANSSSTSAKDTTGYPIPNLVGGYVFYGALTLTPVNSNKSIWSISGNILNNTSSGVILCSGFGSLSGALDCVGLVMPTGGGGNFVSVMYI